MIFLFSWKFLRLLFMRMVDRQLKIQSDREEYEAMANGIEEGEEDSADIKHRHEMIFFGSKDRSAHAPRALYGD